MKKRFVITINDEEDDFIVETPDGEVGLDYLIDVLGTIHHDLTHYKESPTLDDDDEEEVTPTENRLKDPVNKKDLN